MERGKNKNSVRTCFFGPTVATVRVLESHKSQVKQLLQSRNRFFIIKNIVTITLCRYTKLTGGLFNSP